MARISLADAQAWAESSKIPMPALDAPLLLHTENIVLGELNRVYDALTVQNVWVNDATTPALVKSLIAMKYVSLYYDRQYSENDGLNPWARRLDRMYADLRDSVLSGDIDLPEVVGYLVGVTGPRFYPTDASTAERGPTVEDPAAGPAAFSMTTKF